MPAFFQGQRIVTPQAVSYVDDSALANTNSTQPAGVVAIIGLNDSPSSGGQPQTPLTFTDPAQARRVLRDGSLLQAVERAFAPGPSGGAGTVVALRVNPALQSTAVLKDTTGSPLTAINLTSRDYGQYTQRIRVDVMNPVSSIDNTGKDVVVSLDGQQIVGHNVGRVALQIRFLNRGVGLAAPAGSVGAGNAQSATASVTYSGGVGKLFTNVTYGSASTADDIPATGTGSLLFSDYPYLTQLVQAINDTGKYEAKVLYNQATGVAPDPSTPSSVLDAQTGIDILGGAPSTPAFGSLRADVAAMTDWFNYSAGSLVSATRVIGTAKLANTASTVTFDQGPESVPDQTDWQNCLTVLQNVDAHLIVPLTPTPDLHAMVQAHVNLMSQVQKGYGRRERIGIVGGAAGETPATSPNPSSRAASFSDSRMVVVGPGLRDFDSQGNLVVIPPYMVAAQIAGLIAGLPVGQAITRRYVRAQGIEKASQFPGSQLTQDERETMLLNGVCVLEMIPNRGIRVIQGVTTWTGDQNYARKEISVRRIADWVARSVREACDDLLVGQAGSPELISRAVVVVNSTLTRMVRDGLLVGDAQSPPFRNIIVSLSGDILQIDFEASPAIPANYVLITAHLVPFSGTVTVA